MKPHYEEYTDEELFRISLLKQKNNGNATAQARHAQRELAKRHDVIQLHSTREDGSTKSYINNMGH